MGVWFMEVVAMFIPVAAEVLVGLVILWFAIRMQQTHITQLSLRH